MKVQTVSYAGWEQCCRISNGSVELVVTTEVGPRIIRFGYLNGPNVFVEFPGDLGKVGGDTWRPYGGHRFWHSPESRQRTYIPDNSAVHVEQIESGVRLTQPVEVETSLQKEIEIRMTEGEDRVEILHRLYNRGLWPVACSPWALSMMARGGSAVLPLPPYQSHEDVLLPGSSLILWPYTDLSDPRWGISARFITLRQDPNQPEPQKIGSSFDAGWLAYVIEDHLFIKSFLPEAAADYPDLGSKVELFTNDAFLELETLGAFKPVLPGAYVEHTETWQLHRDEKLKRFDQLGPELVRDFLPAS
jgi:hypothetical protein